MVRRGQRLEYFTIAWNAVEGLVAVGARFLPGSISRNIQSVRLGMEILKVSAKSEEGMAECLEFPNADACMLAPPQSSK